MHRIRELRRDEHSEAITIYQQAVLSCDPKLYTQAQKEAWASQGPALALQLERGRALASEATDGGVLAFALRDPSQRLSLLYCHPEHQQRGHGRALIEAIEAEATQDRLGALETEASLISTPLLLKLGWRIRWREELLIRGVHFERFNLRKTLNPILS
ncbi:MAG: GNAT family N-acetyltransferase [Vulcanococcus sp.]